MRQVTVWRKATASGASNDCVELAYPDTVGVVRDSKNPAVQLTVSISELTRWIRAR